MKTKKHRYHKHKKHKTIKNISIPTKTSQKIRKISNILAKGLENHSYIPTINKQLVSFYSEKRNDLLDCNSDKAFQLKEPLQIRTNESSCHYYYTREAKKILLSNLSKNKHVDPTKIIPPVQLQSNCWFNSMFVNFFVSDKGRLFFHFFRQLMIEGKQKNNVAIPVKLRDAFALLNFGVESCLTGNQYAYQLDTNSIIHSLYNNIPMSYRMSNVYITDINQAGNPLLYYIAIINYLNNKSIQISFIRDADSNWREQIEDSINSIEHIPHIIVLEVFENVAEHFTQKPIQFNTNNATYRLDSAVIRDTLKQHFCSAITCENTEMGYDGMSFHRLVNLKWKQNINSNVNWKFEGTPLLWNFRKCYQLLFYYRVK